MNRFKVIVKIGLWRDGAWAWPPVQDVRADTPEQAVVFACGQAPSEISPANRKYLLNSNGVREFIVGEGRVLVVDLL